MKEVKELYSTGDIARICGVTINTVVKWFETGELKGKRTSRRGARRVTRNSLFSFLKRHSFPSDTAAGERFRVIVVDDDKKAISVFRKALDRTCGYAVEAASSSFEAGLLAGHLSPNIVFVCADLRGVNAEGLAERLHSREDTRGTPLVAVGQRLGSRRREKLGGHFNAVVTKPLGIAQVREIVAAHSP